MIPGALYVEGQKVKTGAVWRPFGEEAACYLLREERVESLRRFLHQSPDERIDAAHPRIVEMDRSVERLKIEHRKLERLSSFIGSLRRRWSFAPILCCVHCGHYQRL